MRRIDLVARKHDARKLDPKTPSGGARSLEIGAKGLDIAPLLQAIEMRERMRADLLGWVVEDSPDERQAVVVGVALLVCPYLIKIMVGGNSRVGIAWLARGKRGTHRRFRREKQKPDSRPCTGDASLGEEVEQGRNDLADPEDIGTVIRN